MARRKRYLKGDIAFRRLIRRMPEAIREEMASEMEAAAPSIANEVRRGVPVRTGALRSGVSYKVLRRSLKLKVGLVGKATARRLFYGRIIEFGRKAQTVNARRAGGNSYKLRVRRLGGKPFVSTSRTRELAGTLGGRLKDYWEKVLAKASQGVSDA